MQRGVWRHRDGQHAIAPAAFEPRRQRIGFHLGVQFIDTRNGHGAVGGDVLPGIGKRAGEIGRAHRMPGIGAHLEHVGASAAERAVDAEVGAGAAERKAETRVRGGAIIGADRCAVNAGRGVVRAGRAVAVDRAVAAVARGPDVPARRECRHVVARRHCGISVALLRRQLAPRRIGILLGIAERAALAVAVTGAIHHRVDELGHRGEAGLRNAGARLAGELCQRTRQCIAGKKKETLKT